MLASAAHAARTAPMLPPIAVPIPEACRLAGIGKSKLWTLIRDGKLQVTRATGRTNVLYASLVEFLTADAS